jgi:hypothetical protein
MEDVYQYAQRGGQIDSLTDYGTFDATLKNILDSLTSPSHGGVHGVIANIPDLDVFPFYTYIPWNGLVLTQQQTTVLDSFFHLHFVAGPNGFMISDPPNSTSSFRQMTSDDYILLTVPSDSIKCHFMGSLIPVPSYYILTASQVASINAAIQHFNGIIASYAQIYKIPLVDMNSYFKNLQSGFYYDGIKFSSTFITGNFFSLDGYHPTAQGYGLLTNEFIKTINSFYHSTIPLVDITKLHSIIFP